MNTNTLAAGRIQVRVLIVEDRPALKQGLRMRLAAETDLCVIGEAPDCTAALDFIRVQSPDIVLIDAEGQFLNGTATQSALSRVCQSASVILLSLDDDATMRACAADVGAAALVSKSAPRDTLPRIIRQVFRAAFVSGNGSRGATPA